MRVNFFFVHLFCFSNALLFPSLAQSHEASDASQTNISQTSTAENINSQLDLDDAQDRQNTSVAADTPKTLAYCRSLYSNADISECSVAVLKDTEVVMNQYLAASFDRFKYDPLIISEIEKSQQAWQAYLNAHCHSIYTQWRDGTIRINLTLECKIKLTQLRTTEIWASYLTYMDSQKPVLPKPNFPND